MDHTPHLTLAGNHCSVHGYHWPTPVRTVLHHIVPQEWGGPTTDENLVKVCDTGHYNIHSYIDATIKKRARPKVTRKERELAERGIEGWRNRAV